MKFLLSFVFMGWNIGNHPVSSVKICVISIRYFSRLWCRMESFPPLLLSNIQWIIETATHAHVLKSIQRFRTLCRIRIKNCDYILIINNFLKKIYRTNHVQCDHFYYYYFQLLTNRSKFEFEIFFFFFTNNISITFHLFTFLSR